MKLKKTDATETGEPTVSSTASTAVIADRFKLDAEPVQSGPSGAAKAATAIAFLASLAAAAMVGAVAAMMYVNWELLANV